VTNVFDRDGFAALMDAYPAGEAVALYDPPVANFMAVFAGRLALNNGLSVAAMSVLDPEIAQAVLQQFFTGASGGERFLADVPDDLRAESYALATEQRAAAASELADHHARLMADRRTGRSAADRDLEVGPAWERFVELCRENAVEHLSRHLMVSGTAGEFQVRLGGVLDAAGLDPQAVVPLCSGLGDVESAKPALALYDLAVLARERPAVRAALAEGDLDGVVSRLADPPDSEWRTFGDAFGEFLVQWGYRVQGEADFTNPDWSERPEFALSQVRSMMALGPGQAPREGLDRAAADRVALEEGLRSAVPATLRPAFDEMLASAQHFTRLRELSKAVWVLGVRRTRGPYLALDRGLVAAGVVEGPGDVAFLTFGELAEVATGGRIEDARERVARRRAQAAEAAHYRLPDNWVGEPRVERIDVGEQRDTFTGLGVSTGDGPVTGSARIIRSVEAGMARDIEPGEILVAPYTDAPWTSLFVVAGAVVVETGGVLSHAATVARELGIPAVVMVKDATSWIGDGDVVTVDGAAGTVTVVSRAGA
jgi:pyruvate,water dikinase